MRRISIVTIAWAALLITLLQCSSRHSSVHYAVYPCPDAGAIHSKWDLWNYGTCLRGANIWQKAVDLLITIPIAALAFFGAAYGLRVAEVQDVVALVRRRLGR